MNQPGCRCMASAAVCEACGTPCRVLVTEDGRVRAHLILHRVVEDGSSRGVFGEHTPEACKLVRMQKMAALQMCGALREDLPR